LFRSSAAFNTKYDFFQLRKQINQTATKFQAYFAHWTRLKCRENASYLSLKPYILITKFTRQFYSASLNCPPSALTQARRRLRKLTTDFLIASCGNSSHILSLSPLQSRRLFL